MNFTPVRDFDCEFGHYVAGLLYRETVQNSELVKQWLAMGLVVPAVVSGQMKGH